MVDGLAVNAVDAIPVRRYPKAFIGILHHRLDNELASVEVWQNHRRQNTIAESFKPKSRPRRHNSEQ